MVAAGYGCANHAAFIWRNFPFVSDLFFNYFPLYNKFRAVESILVSSHALFPDPGISGGKGSY